MDFNLWMRGTMLRLTLSAVATVTAALTLSAPTAVAAPATGAAAAGPLAEFHRQRPVWTACEGVDDARLECAAVRVPLDYDRPRGRTITVTMSRLPAADPAARRGVLATTNGGPGGPGVALPLRLAGLLDPRVPAAYDLVGFDIRGVERSTPVSCGQPVEEPGGYWVRTFDPARFDDHVAQARSYAADCVRESGWLLPHLTTADAARDLDVIRAVLGEPKLSYLGGSAAAAFGAIYAGLFGDRVDRLVLDSVPDTALLWRSFDSDRSDDIDRGVTELVEWIAARDAEYGLGDTPVEVSGFLARLTDRLAAGPVTVGDHAWTLSELGNLLVVGAFYETLNAPVAASLRAISVGEPAPFDPAALYPARSFQAADPLPVDNTTAANTAYRCGDERWPGDPALYLREATEAAAGDSPFMGGTSYNINPCAFWPTGDDVPVDVSATTVTGALFIGATRDVATPYDGTLRMRDRIAGSALVTVDVRDHVPHLSANPCVHEALTNYLITGVADDVTC